MKLLSRVLIPLTLFTFVSSQTFNLKTADNILHKNYGRVRASQNNLKGTLFNFASGIRSKTVSSSKSNKVKAVFSKLEVILGELQKFADEITSIGSPEIYQNSSTNCEDITYKIIRIEQTMRKNAALRTHSWTNLTMLTNYLTSLTSYAKEEKSTVDFSSIISNGNAVVGNFSEYIKALGDSIKAEATVKANLENYRRGKCVCAAEKGISSSTVLSTLIKVITDGDVLLRTDQNNLKSAITSAASKINSAITLNFNDPASFYLKQILLHSTRVSTCIDHPPEVIKAPNCPALLTVVGQMDYRAWFYGENLFIAMRNLTYATKYQENLKQILTTSTDLTSIQKTSLESVNQQIALVISGMTKYSNDLKTLRTKSAYGAGELKKLAEGFCLCKTNSTPIDPSVSTMSTSTESTSTTSTSTSTTSTSTSTTISTSTSSTSTTTSTILSTTSSPHCKMMGEILNANGIPIKKVCIIGEAFTLANADLYCKKLNMSLYTITDNPDARALKAIMYKVSMALFGHCNSNLVYRVNGRQLSNLTWVSYNPDNILVPSEAIPTSGSGQSLVVQGADTNIAFSAAGIDNGYWPICEFDKVTPATTTAAPIQNNFTCLSSVNITDPNGNYLKTACMVPIQANFSVAYGICRNNNMNLFAITNANEYYGLAAWANKTSMEFFKNINKFVTFNINGMQLPSGTWVYYNTTIPLFSGSVPKNGYGCLAIAGTGSSTLAPNGVSCSQADWFVCEAGGKPLIASTPSTSTVDAMPCGTLIPYNISSTLNGPDTLGFPSGIYYDKSIIYPGTTELGGLNCGNQNPGPSRIQTTRSLQGPGGYFSCSLTEWYDSAASKFFVRHPNMAWVPATKENVSTIPGLINVKSPAGIMQLGRVNVTYNNGTFQQIGKVFQGVLYYHNSGAIDRPVSSSYEVLVCKPTV